MGGEMSAANQGMADTAMHNSDSGGMDHAGMSGMKQVDPAMKMVDFKQFDRDEAFKYSQAAIGKEVANYRFTDSSGNPVELQQFTDQPVLISLIYTSCYHICPTTTQHLGRVVREARIAMPDKDFSVLTVGFDTLVDTPEAMYDFGQKQGGASDQNWHFLSADEKTVEALAKDLGFIYYPSPQGFNHLVQTSVLDAGGKIYRQVYGMKFDIPLLIEPLKDLLFNRPTTSIADSVSDKIRFFCTVYDAASDRYRFDYSIFIGMFVGVLSCLVLGTQLVKEWRKSTRN